MSKHTTLVMAHRIRSLRDAGFKQREIAQRVRVDQATVSRILKDQGLMQQRQIADRMESILGGVIIGNGNQRFHAAAPNDDNGFGHEPTHAHHPSGTSWEGDRPVQTSSDPLSELEAVESVADRFDGSEVTVEEDDGNRRFGAEGERRPPSIHEETWADFVARAQRDGLSEGAINKRLENEGADVDVWSVRDPDIGKWGQPS
jgi:transcriptional regulator with XRE-family HTH domain